MKKPLLALFVILTGCASAVFATPKGDQSEVPPLTPNCRPIPWDPAPLPHVEISSQRPRIWFTPAQLPELRKRCKTTCAEAFEMLQANPAKQAEASVAAEFDSAFLYQMSGDAGYAKRAIAIARKVKPFAGLSFNGRGFPYGYWHAADADPTACVFDWCYDQLTPDDKKVIGETIRTTLSRGPYRASFHEQFWVTPWLSEVLALYGAGIDDKLAAEQLIQVNRVLHQFVAAADECCGDSSFGDYQHEFNQHWTPCEMWLHATGENLFRKCGYLGKSPEYFLYLLLADGHYVANDGDGPTDAAGGLGDPFLPSAATYAFYALRNDNPYARWQVRNWGHRPHGGMADAWKAIVWFDPSSDVRPLAQLPLVKHFKTNGCVFLRSGWDLSKKSSDTVAAFFCRPHGPHAHLDAGHFVIWRGLDQLVQRNGFYTRPSWDYHQNFFGRTVAHNCPTIRDPQETVPDQGVAKDGGQLIGSTEHFPISYRVLRGTNPFAYRGEIRTFVDRPGWTYVFADLTPAYEARKAARVTRAFLWLKPATFVICDWTTSTQPEFTKRWLLNVATRPAIDGSQRVAAGSAEAGILESNDTHVLAVTRGKSKLFVQPLLPERPLVRRLGGVGYNSWSDGKNWEAPSMKGSYKDALQEQAKHEWRIEIEPARAATDDVFLNLLDTASAETASPPSTATVKREGGAVGAEIHHAAGARTILFHPDGRASIDGEMIGEALTPLKPFEDQEPTRSQAAAKKNP